jgi:hypothetical protein
VVATTITAGKAVEALRRVRAFVEEYGTDEQGARLDGIQGGRVPTPNRSPIEHAAYTTEALVAVCEILGEHLEESKPRPRGRPRKDASQQTH